MPRPRKNKLVRERHFSWILSRRGGVWWADGRSHNAINAGRHSLGTKNIEDALRLLQRLDSTVAVAHKMAEPEELAPIAGDELPLAVGRKLYEAHISRPRVAGGTKKTTQTRYRPVLDKFLSFLAEMGITNWNSVTVQVLVAYLKYLEENKKSYGTLYLEGNTVKQIVAFLIAQKRLPASARIDLPLRKPQGSDTYCWTKAEVVAILNYTRDRPELRWLYVLLATLAYSGMRIGEAIDLRWRNVDLATGKIKVVDDSTTGRAKGGSAQTNKGGRDRSFPIHDELMPILQGIPKHVDGYVFHGPRGARLKADTIRNILVRDVLAPLAPSFPTPKGETGFADGRLHSFRHFFCSLFAIEGASQQVVMQWLGHRDSKLIQHYFHLHDDQSRRQMGRISLSDGTSPADAV